MSAPSRYDRRAARRYSHMTPWRACRVGWCARCWLREVTGINKRAKAAHIAWSREVAATLTPIVAHRCPQCERMRGPWHFPWDGPLCDECDATHPSAEVEG